MTYYTALLVLDTGEPRRCNLQARDRDHAIEKCMKAYPTARVTMCREQRQ